MDDPVHQAVFCLKSICEIIRAKTQIIFNP